MSGPPRDTGQVVLSPPEPVALEESKVQSREWGPPCPTDKVGLGDTALLTTPVVNELTPRLPAGLLRASCQAGGVSQPWAVTPSGSRIQRGRGPGERPQTQCSSLRLECCRLSQLPSTWCLAGNSSRATRIQSFVKKPLVTPTAIPPLL